MKNQRTTWELYCGTNCHERLNFQIMYLILRKGSQYYIKLTKILSEICIKFDIG